MKAGGFLLSPFLSLFSPKLYREALHSGLGRSFGYLAYLTALFSICIYFLCQFRVLPATTDFVNWFIQMTPEMTLTREGLSANVDQPYLVEHPAFGPLYLIDTTKSSEELMNSTSPALILIGKEKIITRHTRRGETRVFDIREAMAKAENANRPIQLTKSLMKQFADRIKTLIIPLALVLLAPFFFIWKLIAASFYFLIALLLNLARKEKLRPISLFAISCYAISPVAVIQWVTMIVPNLNVNLNFLLAFALTVAYLIYGIFLTPRVSNQVQ